MGVQCMRHSFLTFCINNLRKDKDVNACKEVMGLSSQFILITSDEMSTKGPLKIGRISLLWVIYFLTCQNSNSVIFVFQAPLNATRSHYHWRLQVFQVLIVLVYKVWLFIREEVLHECTLTCNILISLLMCSRSLWK